MTVDYLVVNSRILIFFCLLFPTNELLPLTAKTFTLKFMALHVALLHLISFLLFLPSGSSSSCSRILMFIYIPSIFHLVSSANFIPSFLMGPGSLMKTVNVLCHYRILYHKGALDELFFFASLGFSPAMLSALIPWEMLTATSSSPPAAFSFCEWNCLEGIRVLVGVLHQKLDTIETKQRVWFGSQKFCIFNSSERKSVCL